MWTPLECQSRGPRVHWPIADVDDARPTESTRTLTSVTVRLLRYFDSAQANTSDVISESVDHPFSKTRDMHIPLERTNFVHSAVVEGDVCGTTST